MSSARVVRCTVKSGNERNPHLVFYMSQETAHSRVQISDFRYRMSDYDLISDLRFPISDIRSGRKAGMTSNQHGPYTLGDTRATMGSTAGRQAARRSKSYKTFLSSDWGLQLDPMKPESLVNAYQPWRVEYVLGSCTHRPSHQESWGYPNPPFGGEGKTSDKGEVVTRHP